MLTKIDKPESEVFFLDNNYYRCKQNKIIKLIRGQNLYFKKIR